MAATRKPRSPSSAAAAAGDHLRFLRPGALARLRDARLRRGRRPPTSRQAPPSPGSPSPSPPPPAPAAGGGETGPFLPYYMPVSRLLAPRCPQRKKLTAGKAVTLFAPPSADLPFEAVMEFLNIPDMVVAAH